jgi:hypothetical protein
VRQINVGKVKISCQLQRWSVSPARCAAVVFKRLCCTIPLLAIGFPLCAHDQFLNLTLRAVGIDGDPAEGRF